MDSKIYEWADIRDDYNAGLVLGNGASIAFRFPLRLRVTPAEGGGPGPPLSADVVTVFGHLETSDFELVLRMLGHASQINEALGIADDRTEVAYASVREALIGVVQATHVEHAHVADRLRDAGTFMSHFSTVASLSYDVLVYWAVMAYNAQFRNRLKDCFIDGDFRRDWRWMREPYGSNTGSTLVVYPHGSLALAADVVGSESKILTSDDADLLSTVFETWRLGGRTPVFVSEGTTQQKLAAIRRSPYLSVVHDEILPEMGPSLVAFGWSMGDGDLHLLEAMVRPSVRRYAVAVDRADTTLRESQARIARLIRERMNGGGFELAFFDRASSGCWIAPS